MRTEGGRGFGLAGLALALSFLAGSWAAGDVYAASGQSAAGLTLEVSYGYDGNAKSGRYSPMDVSLTNENEESFQGVLKVATMEYDYEVYSYEYPISVDSGNTLEQEIDIPIGGGSDQVFVSVLDGNGNKVTQKRLKIESSRETAELFVGLLSEHPERLAYLDNVGVSYGALRTRAFSISTEDFPQEENGLDMLDVLVVNDYRLRNLTEEQTGAIMDWVEDGGVMILGTGNRVDDTLGRFAPELLDDSYDNPLVMEIRPEGDGEEDELENEVVEVPCVRVSLHGGTVLTADRGYPLLSVAMREQGVVAVTAYDLGDVAEYGQRHTGFVDGLFTDILGEERISGLASALYGGSGEEYWSVQSAINTGNVEKLPNVGLYFLVTAAYIGLAGPGLYIILKKRENRGRYGVCVAAASVVFTVILYCMGMKTRFTGIFVTYATVEDLTKDTVTETSYVNLRNPYSKPYQVELDPAYTVTPVTRNEFYFYDGGRRTFTGEESSHVSVYYGQNETEVTLRDAAAFESQYFRLTRKQENETGAGLTGNIRYYDGRVTGTVTNQFPFDLETVAVLLYGRLVPVGDLAAGDTVKLDELESYSIPVGNPYAVASFITGLSAYEEADINDKDYMKALERTNLLSFYMQSNLGGYRSDARVVAFGPKDGEKKRAWDERYEDFGLTMLTSALDVDSTSGRMRYRSGMLKRPAVVQGSFDPASNMSYTQEPVTVEYSLGGDLEVSRVEFVPVDGQFSDEKESGGQKVFSGDIYIYDHMTGSFERMEEPVLEGEELWRFLSPENGITVRYIGGDTAGYSWALLPMPMVTGREK